MTPVPHLPDKDFDTSTLSRRQAAVFEHLCELARAGLVAKIGAAEAMVDEDRHPLASDTVRDEARRELKDWRRQFDRVAALQHRLRKIRTAPMTPAERARLDEARRLRPGLTGAEAELALYGMLDLSAERQAAA